MKKLKSLISILTVCCILFSMFSVNVFAAEGDSVTYQVISYADNAHVLQVDSTDAVTSAKKAKNAYNGSYWGLRGDLAGEYQATGEGEYNFVLFLKFDISKIDLSTMDKVELLLKRQSARSVSRMLTYRDVPDTTWVGSDLRYTKDTTNDTLIPSEKYKDYFDASQPVTVTNFDLSSAVANLTYENATGYTDAVDITEYIKAKKNSGKDTVSMCLAVNNKDYYSFAGALAINNAALYVTNVARPVISAKVPELVTSNAKDISFDVSATVAEGTTGTISSLKVYFDDTECTVEEGSATVSKDLLTNGAHTVKIVATDSLGATKEETYTVAVDSTYNNKTISLRSAAHVLDWYGDTNNQPPINTAYWRIKSDIVPTSDAHDSTGYNFSLFLKFDVSSISAETLKKAELVFDRTDGSNLPNNNAYYTLRDVPDTSWVAEEIRNDMSVEKANNHSAVTETEITKYEEYLPTGDVFAKSDVKIGENVNVLLGYSTLETADCAIDITDYLLEKKSQGINTVSMILAYDSPVYYNNFVYTNKLAIYVEESEVLNPEITTTLPELCDGTDDITFNISAQSKAGENLKSVTATFDGEKVYENTNVANTSLSENITVKTVALTDGVHTLVIISEDEMGGKSIKTASILVGDRFTIGTPVFTGEIAKGSTIECCLDVVDNTGSYNSSILVLALYNNGAMVDCNVATGPNVTSNTLETSVTIDKDLELNDCYVKAFIWNSLANIIPLGQDSVYGK